MTVNILVPELGESVVEATVGRWLKREGEAVRVGEPVVELETDKVNLEVGAEKEGVLSRITRQQGEDVKIGDVLGVIDDAAQATQPKPAQPEVPVEAKSAVKAQEPVAAPPTTPAPSPAAPKVEQPQPAAEPTRATPIARKVAEDRGVDLSQVQATGPSSRVMRSDVERYASQVIPGTTQGTTPAIEIRADSHPEREERVKMSRRRRTIAQRLVEATQTTAMLTTFNEVDMSAVMELRDKRKGAFKEKYGVSLGITSFFVKAAIGALKEFPRLNSEIQGDEIILKHYYDIGIAVGSEEGLVVPVLRDADRLSFAAIEQAIKHFAQKADGGTLTLEDLRGGTFTITNGGVFGSMLSTPILNLPQVGILGLHKVEQRPIALNGQVVIHPMMYVALSYDHRIVDGRESVQFLARIKELTEDPTTLLLES